MKCQHRLNPCIVEDFNLANSGEHLKNYCEGSSENCPYIGSMPEYLKQRDGFLEMVEGVTKLLQGAAKFYGPILADMLIRERIKNEIQKKL